MIILTGVVGAGKSLQGQLLADELGYQWLSTGELFRSKLPQEKQKELLLGKLINDDEVIELIKSTIRSFSPGKEAILDGFPRTIVQAEWLIRYTQLNNIRLEAVINLAVSKDVSKARLLARGRSDDSEEAIKERFREYDTKVVPIIDFFKSQGIQVYDIDGTKTPEEVHKDIMRYLSV